MAWGFWTTYSANTYKLRLLRQQQQQRARALSPPTKRERSIEREARAERDRLLRSSSSGSVHDDGGGGVVVGGGGVRPLAPNHVPPDKVAYERRLLLGDPDWGSRTAADRNTLPRKQRHDYSGRGGSVTPPPEEVYYGRKSPSGDGRSRRDSRKGSGGDDVFCPACAHQSLQQNSSNRESRVSFGSVASSSRGSRGSRGSSSGGQRRLAAGSGRGRSRSQEDDDESSSRGGGRALSSSVPTPPPPPFLSQRDIAHSSLMETINQKMSILSSIRNALPGASAAAAAAAAARGSSVHGAPPGGYPLHPSNSYHHGPLPQRPQTAPRRHSSGKHHSSSQRNFSSKSNGRKQSSSTSLKEHDDDIKGVQGQQQQHPDQQHQQSLSRTESSNMAISSTSTSNRQTPPNFAMRSSRSSSRMTPRGSSSHASHESIKSGQGSGKGIDHQQQQQQHHSKERRAKDGSYEKLGINVNEDVPGGNSGGGSVIGIHKVSSAVAMSSTDRSRSHSQTPEDEGNESGDERSIQETGTVRRRRRRSSKSASQERLERERQLIRQASEERLIHSGGRKNDQGSHFRHSHESLENEAKRPRPYQHHRPYSRSQEHLDADGRPYCTSSGGSRYSSKERIASHRGLTKSQEQLGDHHSRHSYHYNQSAPLYHPKYHDPIHSIYDEPPLEVHYHHLLLNHPGGGDIDAAFMRFQPPPPPTQYQQEECLHGYQHRQPQPPQPPPPPSAAAPPLPPPHQYYVQDHYRNSRHESYEHPRPGDRDRRSPPPPPLPNLPSTLRRPVGGRHSVEFTDLVSPPEHHHPLPPPPISPSTTGDEGSSHLEEEDDVKRSPERRSGSPEDEDSASRGELVQKLAYNIQSQMPKVGLPSPPVPPPHGQGLRQQQQQQQVVEVHHHRRRHADAKPPTLTRPDSYPDQQRLCHQEGQRPRSASIGDRLLEPMEHQPSQKSDVHHTISSGRGSERRHHTLDNRRHASAAAAGSATAAAAAAPAPAPAAGAAPPPPPEPSSTNPDRRLASMTSFQSTLPSSSMSATSSRSGKSSSRSSKSPSIENLKIGNEWL